MYLLGPSPAMTHPPVRDGQGAAPLDPRWLLGLLALQLGRALLLPAFELSPQEAYYAFYAAHPALSYFDHPPLLAWSLHLSLAVFGHSALAVRAVPFVLTTASGWALLGLARRFVPDRAGETLLLLGATGAATVLSLLALPDAPLVLAWILALRALAAAALDGRRWAWPLAGLFMGLAFDSKYTGVFLQLGLLLFLGASPPHRRLLRTAGPWIALGVAHAVAAPVYVWNAEHHFASFLFQTSGRAQSAAGPGVRNLFGLAGTQLVLLLPPLAFALVRCAARGLRRAASPAARDPEETFLAAFFLPMALGFTALSVGVLVKPNWLLPAYVTGGLWAARDLPRRFLRWNLAWSLALHALFLVELLAYPVRLETDDTWVGWRALGTAVEARARPGEFVFSADDYKTSAELLFHTPLEVYGRNVLGERALQFDHVGTDLAALRGRDALYVDSAPRDFSGAPAGRPPAAVSARFRSVSEEVPIVIRRGDRVLRTFHVFRCRGYLGP